MGLGIDTYIQNAESWAKQNRYRKAIEQYDLAILELSKSSQEDERLGDCHQEIGSLWRLLGNNKFTGMHFTKAKDYFVTSFGDTKPHIKIATIYYLLGSFLEQIWKLKPSEDYYTTSLAQLTALLEKGHSHIVAAQESIKRVQNKKLEHKK